MVKEFKKKSHNNGEELFFRTKKAGRKTKDTEGRVTDLIVTLRKQYLSVTDIKVILDAKGYKYSTRQISTILHTEGFARLPRRGKSDRSATFSNTKKKVTAPKRKKINHFFRIN